ncbi:MAG: CvpA family protein [Cyclobacteriaceae bacterium]|nr:CvpA family protein [Cyclobacteriaceae bacterium HetDA_MAG_MS6]
MSLFDIFFLVIFGLAAFKGYSKGLIVELFSLVAFFIGLFAAITFTIPVTTRFFSESEWYEIIAVGVFIALFLGLSIVVNLVAKALKKIVHLTFLGLFDNILGALAAVFKWALILSIIFWVVNAAGLSFPDEYVKTSVIMPYILLIGPKTFGVVGDIIPFFKEIFDSIDKFEEKGRFV